MQSQNLLQQPSTSAISLSLGIQLTSGSQDLNQPDRDSAPDSPIRHLPSLLPAMSGINAQDVASYWNVRKRALDRGGIAMSPDILASGGMLEEIAEVDDILALDPSIVQAIKVTPNVWHTLSGSDCVAVCDSLTCG